MALHSQTYRRRRRRRSHRSRVVTQPVRHSRAGRRIRLHSAEVLASIGIVIAAATLVALIWLIPTRSIEAERNDLRARIEATVSSQSVVLADELRRELLSIQQSLRILREAFQADPDHFDINAWLKQMPALTDVTDDAFIADAQYIIRHGINPAEVGLGIGSQVPGMFGRATDKPAPDEDLRIDPNLDKLQTRQHLSLMMMRLDHPGGWVVGVSYRTDALRRMFAEANLGVQGMTAVIDTRLGRVLAVVGQAAANPNYDIAKSAMYAALQLRPDSTWIGPTAPDGVERIHAFHRVPGHQLSVVVAVGEADAMRPAIAFAQDMQSVAIAATLVVLAAMGVALFAVWTFRAKRRLRQSLEREQISVANAQTEAAGTRTLLGGRASQLQALFAGIEEGVAVLDAELRLTEWNPRFPALFGVAPDTLRRGLPLDELLRTQAREGAFGAVDDIEGEVARRLAHLRDGNETVPVLYAGSGGRTLAVLTSRHADGSLMLMVRDATKHETRSAAEEPETSVAAMSPPPGAVETA